jgi:tetratricopeptide (TPR) repeat protein
MFKQTRIDSRKQILLVYIALTVVTLAVYWQVNQFDFVNIDDGIYVTENSRVQSGITLKSICWSFFTTYAEFWHPLTWISLMLDYRFFGLNAGGFHRTNLLLHLLNTLMLFWLFHRMTGAIWKSAFVSAFFALHPLHVESVAWIAERKDVLSAFFWMLTLCLYVLYVEKPVITRYLLVLSAFVLALMSKPMVVTLPVIMLLLDYWPLRRFESKKANLLLWPFKEKVPLFACSIVFSAAAFLAQSNPEAIYYSLSSRISNATVSFISYLVKAFWPHGLAFFYPFPSESFLWSFWGSAILMIVISVIVIAMAKRLPYLLTGWMWYGIAILPVLGIIQVGKHGMADRYTYLPLIGIGMMLAWGVPRFFSGKNLHRKLLWPVGVLFLSLLAFFSWRQCGYWENSTHLFRHAIQVTQNNYLAHHNLGLALFAEGKIKEAVAEYNKALEAKPMMPDYVLIYNNRAAAYTRLGLYPNALADFTEVLRLKPDHADALYMRAMIDLEQGNTERGCPDARKACDLGHCGMIKAAREKGDCR